MPLPSDKSGWSEFLKSPDWTDVGDEELATAFRKFALSCQERPANILSHELWVRIAAYAKEATSLEEVAEEARNACFEDLCTPGSRNGINLCVKTQFFVRARVKYLNKRRGVRNRRNPPLEDTLPDLQSPRPENVVFLSQLLDSIDDPRERHAFDLLLAGHSVGGRDSVATKLGIKEHEARALISRAQEKLSKAATVDR